MLRATDENVPIARASGLPAANVDGRLHRNCACKARTASLARAVSSTVQPQAFGADLFGRRGAQFDPAAETRVDAGGPILRGTEAILFTQVVGAYMDVIRDEAIVVAQRSRTSMCSTSICRRRNDRFQVGDLTRTDVAQSRGAARAGAQPACRARRRS